VEDLATKESDLAIVTMKVQTQLPVETLHLETQKNPSSSTF